MDGEVAPLGLLERVSPSSEVHFVAAISGGWYIVSIKHFHKILFAVKLGTGQENPDVPS